MNEPTNAMSLEILKTARDFAKLYVRANPDSIRDKDPGTLLEIHKAFLDGLRSQAKELAGPDGQPISFNIDARQIHLDAKETLERFRAGLPAPPEEVSAWQHPISMKSASAGKGEVIAWT